MAKRLTENHPLSKKVEQLEKYMREIGISLYFDGYHLNVIDTQSNVSAEYRDKESGEAVNEFPYVFEAKLVIED